MQQKQGTITRDAEKNEVVEIKNANRNEDKIEQNNPKECSKYIKEMKRSRNQLKNVVNYPSVGDLNYVFSPSQIYLCRGRKIICVACCQFQKFQVI